MHSVCIDKFLGVDFSQDASTVDERRSPDAVNIMPSNSGLLEKRVGYRKLNSYDGALYGIFVYKDKVLTFAGESIYDGDEVLISGLCGKTSASCIFCDKLWILTGEEFLIYDGSEISHVKDIATVPQVLSQCDNHMREGITYQPFNMLTRRRSFGIKIPNGGMNIVTIPMQVDDKSLKIYFKTSGEIIPIRHTYYTNAGQFCIEFNQTYFTNSVGDEVIVEFTPQDTYTPIIEKCTFITSYDDRIFVGGNPDYPNTDFYSELLDGAYFSDLNYTKLGTSEGKTSSVGNKILGYSLIGDNLAIHTEGEESTIYLRSRNMSEEGTIYPVISGINGDACVSSATCKNLMSDPLYLTRNGVFAIGHEDITFEKSIRPRSSRVNARLCNEPNLENAKACVWLGFYMIFINGRVYLADSKAKSYPRNSSGDFEYEWYYWENVPATAVCASGEDLYFGDGEGNFYRFNNDQTDDEGEILHTAFNDDGNPIYTRWTTKMTDGGDWTQKKLLLRRGSGVYVKTYKEGGFVRVKLRTERDFGVEANEERFKIFSFKNLSYEDFTFNTLPFSFLPFNKKVKDYRMMQVILENDKLNSPLGIISIRWHYKKGGFVK